MCADTQSRRTLIVLRIGAVGFHALGTSDWAPSAAGVCANVMSKLHAHLGGAAGAFSSAVLEQRVCAMVSRALLTHTASFLPTAAHTATVHA